MPYVRIDRNFHETSREGQSPRPLKKLIVLLVLISPHLLAQTPTPTTEELVNQLRNTETVGYGYSALFSGSEFLPRQDSGEWSTAVIGADPPLESGPMKAIVNLGATAIAPLVAHLDDVRPTKIKPVSGMMWMAWNDEYDFNRRTRKHTPEGVNRDSFDEGDRPSDHQLTVGDLCFVALGQIVNRHFSATRYQPTGGLVISSPTASTRLLAVVREDYSNMTPAKHKEQLIQDFKQPDGESRRNGAVMRIAYYYPDELDGLVIEQLKVPTFNGQSDYKFIHTKLYPETSIERRKQMFATYVDNQGPAAKDGVLLQLFNDLDLQIANELHNLHPRLKEKYDARNGLTQLFGYTAQVKVSDRPYVTTWNEAERARFIESVGSTSHASINDAVYRVFSTTKDDDYLAVRCMKVLSGTGHDEEFVEYCKHRIGKSQYENEELKRTLQTLTKHSHD